MSLNPELPPIGPLDPPAFWPDEVKAQVAECRKRYFGTETPDDSSSIVISELHESNLRNAALENLLNLLGVRFEEAEFVFEQTRSMTTQQVVDEAERMRKQLGKLAVRHLLVTHPPLDEETIATLREFPPPLAVALPTKYRILNQALVDGTYDELIAEGVVPGSEFDEDADYEHDPGPGQPVVAAHGDPFSTHEHSEAVSRMKREYEYNPFSGGTVSLNDLFASLDDDDTVN